jgi:predicted TIM-barrel fold metal-dependent hydrolase
MGSYGDLLRVFDEVLKPADTDQLEKFFATNAERIYRV